MAAAGVGSSAAAQSSSTAAAVHVSLCLSRAGNRKPRRRLAAQSLCAGGASMPPAVMTPRSLSHLRFWSSSAGPPDAPLGQDNVVALLSDSAVRRFVPLVAGKSAEAPTDESLLACPPLPGVSCKPAAEYCASEIWGPLRSAVPHVTADGTDYSSGCGGVRPHRIWVHCNVELRRLTPGHRLCTCSCASWGGCRHGMHLRCDEQELRCLQSRTSAGCACNRVSPYPRPARCSAASWACKWASLILT